MHNPLLRHPVWRPISLGFVLLTALAGCNVGVPLRYPDAITPPIAAARGESIDIVRLADTRKNKQLQGTGTPVMGQVVLEKPNAVGAWVTQALAAELIHAGAHAMVVDRLPRLSNSAVITGAVTGLVTHYYTAAISSTVTFTLTVTKGGTTVLSKQYSGSATHPYFGFTPSQQVGAVVAAALQNAMTQAVPDIIKVIAEPGPTTEGEGKR